MEHLSRAFSHLPREYPSRLQLASLGFVPDKKARVTHVFSSYNFSFILEGRGTYCLNGREHNITAPSVITQWPGEKLDYWPQKSWSELYLIYPESCGAELRRRKLFKESLPFWHIAAPDAVMRQTRRLWELVENKNNIDPDRIDVAAEALLVESLRARVNQPESEMERKIRAISALFQKRFAEYIDCDELAREYGMSLTTFRRYWLKYIGMPPGRFQDKLLIREACRLLVETPDPIHDIAARLNFADPLYFSKKFHQHTGLTPTAYRKLNRHYPNA